MIYIVTDGEYSDYGIRPFYWDGTMTEIALNGQ